MINWFWIILCAGIALACFFLLVMVIDGNRFKVVSYHLQSEKVEKKHRFVLLADLHNKSYGKNNHRLITKIREFQPEAIYMAGDMMTAKNGCAFDRALALMETLCREYPVYYSMGNHESRLFLHPQDYGNLWESYEAGVIKTGTQLLRNQGKAQGEKLYVRGLDLEHKFYRHFKLLPMSREYLNGVLGLPDASRYEILLAHNPDYFKSYAAWGADLVLSGHVHGGVMRLPLLGGVISPALRLFPRFDGGLFREGKSVMILSRGLGMHTLPVRIFNPGELVLITLSPEGKLAKKEENE